MTDPFHYISRYLPVIKKIPKAEVLQIGALSEEQTAATAEAVRQARGTLTIVEAEGEKAAKKLKPNQLISVSSLSDLEWKQTSLDWVFLLVHTASYNEEVLLEALGQIEQAVRSKRSICFVLETEAPEKWQDILRRVFISWRIVVDKKQEERLLFTAQK